MALFIKSRLNASQQINNNLSTHILAKDHTEELSCLFFYFPMKTANAVSFFSLKPFSYQMNKTWHVGQYSQKIPNISLTIWSFKDEKGNQNFESAFNSQIAGTCKKYLTKIYKYNTEIIVKKCSGKCIHVYHTVLTYEKYRIIRVDCLKTKLKNIQNQNLTSNHHIL